MNCLSFYIEMNQVMNVSKLAKIRNVRLELKKLSPKRSYSLTKGSQKSFGRRRQNLKVLEHFISTRQSVEHKSITRLQRQHSSSSLSFDENSGKSLVSSDNTSSDNRSSDNRDSDDITDDTATPSWKAEYEHDKSLDSSHGKLFGSSSSDDITPGKQPKYVFSDDESDTSNDNKHRDLLSDTSEESCVLDDDNVPLSKMTPRFDKKPSKILCHEADLSLCKSKHSKWPVDTSKRECIRRDNVIRPYITNHDWYVSAEFHLVRTLVMKPPLHWRPYSCNYPFIFDFEWVNEEGKGDLIYTDGNNNFLVVEVKSMYCDGYGSGQTHRTKKRQKRRDGEKQTEIYSQLWHEKNPQVKKTTGVFVTEDDVQKINCFTR